MIRILVLACLLAHASAHSCGVQTCTATTCKFYSYEGATGPSNWSALTNSALCGTGTRQSPINIVTSAAQRVDLGDIRFGHRYFHDISGTYTNDGDSASFTPNDLTGLIISGGPYGTNTYQLAQFHFHYGCENHQGSEHTIDGQAYSLEMHLVHYNTAYGNLTAAKAQANGLAVLGILFKARHSYDESYEELEHGTRSVNCIRQPGTTASGHIRLGDFIQTVHAGRYYTYSGSLTTPECQESVTWSVFPRIITIEPEQMRDFRALFNCRCGLTCNNFRPVQPLNGRVVQYNH